jgi:hypothetical protein
MADIWRWVKLHPSGGWFCARMYPEDGLYRDPIDGGLSDIEDAYEVGPVIEPPQSVTIAPEPKDGEETTG